LRKYNVAVFGRRSENKERWFDFGGQISSANAFETQLVLFDREPDTHICGDVWLRLALLSVDVFMGAKFAAARNRTAATSAGLL
jgi:hypothetical protein